MIQRMLTSAVLAGAAAGLLAAVLHFSFVQNEILLGEKYESGAAVHFAGVPAAESVEAGHDHTAIEATAGADPAAIEAGGHSHVHAVAEGESQLSRNAFTLLFMGVVYIGYAMLLVAGFAIANQFGHRVTAREGLLWGIAGFATFQLMPAMGLSPELPGTMAADLLARQIWWLGTAICTGAALALIGYGRGIPAYALAVVLAALPHVIGAPELDGFSGVAPPEVAGAFAARALGVGLVVWTTLGWLSGRLWGGKAA